MAKKEFPEIKKKNRGKFTKWVKRNMKGTSTCSAADTSPISSKKSVPPSAIAKRPGLSFLASVKAPAL